jgi:hypothetical protein
VRAAELDVDALVEARLDPRHERAQPGRVQVAEVDEGGALQRRRAGEVDVIADEHGRPRRPLRPEPAAAVGEHEHAAARGRRGADVVDDGGGRRGPRRGASGCRRRARADRSARCGRTGWCRRDRRRRPPGSPAPRCSGSRRASRRAALPPAPSPSRGRARRRAVRRRSAPRAERPRRARRRRDRCGDRRDREPRWSRR